MIHDRGNIKWGNAFIQPEHLKMLNELYKEQEYNEKPILDEHQLMVINALIYIAVKDDLTVRIKYFKDNSFQELKGRIIFIESMEGYIKLNNDGQTKVLFNDIVEVTIL